VVGKRVEFPFWVGLNRGPDPVYHPVQVVKKRNPNLPLGGKNEIQIYHPNENSFCLPHTKKRNPNLPLGGKNEIQIYHPNENSYFYHNPNSVFCTTYTTHFTSTQ
jgi:hypothetical protein